MYTPSLREENGKAVGFTLLELLIVIGIMVILGTVLVLVLNPAETLKKARDNQRISDLATLKTAIALYVTNTTTPYLGSAVADGTSGSNATCQAGASWVGEEATGYIYYSWTGAAITDRVLDGTTFTGTAPPGGGGGALKRDSNAVATAVDGTGWVPVVLSGLTGGSPIASYPLDPTNNLTVGGLISTDLVYRYACNSTNTTFEIDAQLESTAYTSTDDKRAKDGGNNANYYETGTNLSILGTGTDF